MPLHDKLEHKAASIGKKAPEFRTAAQKHANATWFFFIIAGVVWYLADDWEWALFPIAVGVFTAFQSVSSTMIATRLENQEQSSATLDADFVQIVQAYGKVLETSAPVPGTVADTNKLPFPKQVIKNAIIAALHSIDDPQMKEHLKSAYIQLSDWQEGVGKSNQGLDISTIDLRQDTESFAKAVMEKSSGSEKWLDTAKKEHEALEQELHQLGL